MNCDEFNKCSDELCVLENIILKSGVISKDELLAKKLGLIDVNLYLKNEQDSDKFMEDYHFYLTKIIINNDLRYK